MANTALLDLPTQNRLLKIGITQCDEVQAHQRVILLST